MLAAMVRKKKQTLVDKLARDIAAEIFRGGYPPGTRLPPIRTLASEFDTTVPTTQRAIAKVEEMGLLHVVQGSGMLVLDPRTHAGLTALPYWLDAILEDPEAATEILGDFLELRRQMAAEIAVRARSAWSAECFDEINQAIDLLESAIESDAPLEFVAKDLAVFRALLRVSPQLAYATVFNAMERIMFEVPEVVQAMYADPETNVQGLRSFALLIESDESDEDVREIVAGMLEHFDRETLKNFKALLEAR